MTNWKKAAEIQEYKFEDEKKQPPGGRWRETQHSRLVQMLAIKNATGIPNIKPNLYSVGAVKAQMIVNYQRAVYTTRNTEGVICHAFIHPREESPSKGRG